MHTISTAALCLLLTTPIQAGELLYSYIENNGDHYYLSLDMRVEGESSDIYRILTDFDHITDVNDTIVYSKLLKTEGKKHIVHTESEGCVWIFCQRVKQVAEVTELGQGFMMSITDAAQSDLAYGRTLWQVIDEGSTTRIKYNADYVPKFWVPPLIGTSIFKDRMLEEGKKTINGIEKLAAESTADELF